MEARTEIPPVIESPRRAFGPIAFFGLVAAAIGIAWLIQFFGLSIPKCSMLKFTGIPCAFCGGTRSLQAIGHLDFANAFWWNPLVMMGAIGAAVAAIFSFLAPRMVARIAGRAQRWPLMWIGLGVVMANWIFVAMFLPR